MKISNNVILITGGSSGIGLALAKRFLSEGNQVIISGRNEEKQIIKRLSQKRDSLIYFQKEFKIKFRQ